MVHLSIRLEFVYRLLFRRWWRELNVGYCAYPFNSSISPDVVSLHVGLAFPPSPYDSTRVLPFQRLAFLSPRPIALCRSHDRAVTSSLHHLPSRLVAFASVLLPNRLLACSTRLCPTHHPRCSFVPYIRPGSVHIVISK
jgi:hypothetical protein